MQDNITALHLASQNGHDKVVRVLLAAKAAVNTQDKVSSILYALSRHMIMTCLIGVICLVHGYSLYRKHQRCCNASLQEQLSLP